MLKKILLSLLFIGTILNATVPTEESVTKLYIATFDRAPDKEGLEYWLHKSGLHLEEIAISFFDQKETKEKYPSGFTNADFIEAIYQNLFKRRADSSGFEYWHGELEAGTIGNSVFILAIINGARGDDAKILHNKTQVGLAFERAGKIDVEEARLIMVYVTAEEDTVSSALCKYSLSGCLKPKEEITKNSTPLATAQTITVKEDTKDNIITLAGTDANNDTLTFKIETQPTHGSLTGTAPNIKYTPTSDYNGTDSFTFKVNDGTVDSSSATVSITITDVAETNNIPVATPQSKTVDEDSTDNTITLAGTDADSGDTLTFKVETQPIHGTLDVSALPIVKYTPTANYSGTDSFTFKVNDGTVDSSSATVSITVTDVAEPNTAPVATPQSKTLDEDSSNNTITLAGTDADSGDTLTFIVETQPSHGTLDVSALPIVKYTPTANYSGTDSFTFKVNDGTVDSSSATVSITVTAVNDAPEATAQSGQTYAEDSSNNSITLAGSDIDGDTLTYVVVANPSHGTLDVTNLPNITYTPTANYAGTDSFTFKVNDGNLDSTVATVEFTVTGSNDTPIAQLQNGLEFTEDSSNNSITLVGTDADNDTLTFSVETQPSNGILDVSALPIVKYTPTANYNGTDSFTFKVNDGTVDSSSATVSITVTAVNDAPTITSTATTTATEDIEYNYTPTITDVENNTITWTILNQPTGMTINSSTGQVLWTPLESVTSSGAVTITATDDGSPNETDTESFTITVTAVNDAPTITSTATTTATEDIEYSYTPTVTDAENNTIAWTISNAPTGMSINSSSGAITWTPLNGVTTSSEVTITATDDGTPNQIATELFTIGVTAVNDAPSITSTATTTATEDVEYSYSPVVTDEESDTITWIISGEPTSMTINASSGAIAWTPLEGVTSSGEVTITATDDGTPNASVNELFTITVTQVNDAPTITSVATTTATDASEYSYTPTVTDAENNTITWTILNAPTGMTIDSSTGEVLWSPAQGITTSEEVTITATDDGTPNEIDIELFTITVEDVTNPTITITDDTSEVLGVVLNSRVWEKDTVTFTFEFSEPVTGFTADDITVTNGAKEAFNGADGDISYTLVVTPSGTINAKETITVAVASSVAVDTSSNGNEASNSTQEIDLEAPFITTWKTDNTGISSDTQVTISTNSTYNYNYNIDWGDGTTNESQTGDITHTYGSANTYTIKITGTFPAGFFESSSDNQDNAKLTSIVQWGTQNWESMEFAFYGCSNLNGAISDDPDLSGVANMEYMFRDATIFNQDLIWGVSSVTNMYKMFHNAQAFNGDISGWDVTSVTDMSYMFSGASAFNQSLNSWDVSSVTNMEYMFIDAGAFNGDITSWIVSSVTNMKSIFRNADAFNQNIDGWNVSSVIDMSYMFRETDTFNQGLSSWNVSSVTNMYKMFTDATAFTNQSLSGWTVTNVTDHTDFMVGTGTGNTEPTW